MSYELPRYNFNGSFSPEIVAALSSAVDKIPPKLTLQQNWSSQRAENVRDLLIHQIDWCDRNLGLDVKKRLPNRGKIRFLPHQDFRDQALDDTSSAHFNAFTGEINVVEEAREEETLYKLSHEFNHRFGYKLFGVREIPETNQLGLESPIVVGYRTTDGFRGLNEWLTELMNIDIHTSNGGTQIGEVALQTTQVAYTSGVFYIDLLVNEASKKLHVDSKEMRKHIYTGLFLDGNTQRLKALDNGLKIRLAEAFAFMNDTEYGAAGLTDITKILGLDLGAQLEDKVLGYEEGFPTPILECQTIKMNLHH